MSHGSIIAPQLRENQATLADETRARSLAEQIPSVIDAIEIALATLEPQVQHILLRSILMNSPSDTPFESAMKTLVLSSPVLTAFSRQAAKESEVRHAIGGPFLFWALSKPWASKMSMNDISHELNRWTDASGGRYTSNPMAAGFFASVALPLLNTRLAMSTAKKRKLHAAFFDAIQDGVGFSKLHSWSTALTHPLLINLGHLAQSCNTESCRYTTVGALWDDATKKTLAGMRSAGQEAFLASILDSDLSSSCKLRIAMHCEAHVWLEPSLVPGIAALLPVPEKARLTQLNWPPVLALQTAAQSGLKSLNQLLVSTYCPDLNVLLDLSLSPQEWCDPAIIMKHVRAFTAKTTTFELPTDMEFAP